MSFLSSLTNCRSLEILDFSDNILISGGLVGNFSDSLQRFSASRCNIKGSIPSEFGNLSRLISIKLDDNGLTGTIPTTIGGLKELQSLSLGDNKLEGPIPSQLCHLTKLGFLVLTNNNLSGPIPACLGNVVSLRQLLLGSNMFSSSIPSTLTRVNDLLLLNLSSNSLSGPLPIDIGKWTAATKTSLRSFVKETLPSMLNHVGDTNLLSTAGRKHVADNNCAVSVLQVALECSVEKPYKRPDMKEVVKKLEKIKVKLMKDMME
ncbi:hypothetical protein V6N13_129225 [Hibiscus sabdariffa]